MRKKVFKKEQIENIKQRYLVGKETLKQISKSYDVCWSVIRRVLLENQTILRSAKFQAQVVHLDQEQNILKMHNIGKTIKEISKSTGVGIRKIRSILENANIKPREVASLNRRKLSAEQKIEIAKKYQSGSTLKDLGTEYDVSQPTIATALEGQNVRRRDTSEAKGGLSKEKKEEIGRLYLSGKNTVEIGNLFGITDSTVGNYLNELNIPRKTNAEVYGSFTKEEEEEVIRKYFNEGKHSVEIAADYGKNYKSVLRLIEKIGTKRTLSESKLMTRNMKIDIDLVCQRYENGESSIAIADDYQMNYATIIDVLIERGIEIRDRGTLGDSITHILNGSGNFVAERETAYYIFTLKGYEGLLKPGITYDIERRVRARGGSLYDANLLTLFFESRTHAYFLEQAVLKETLGYFDAPKELLDDNWEGSYEIRRMDFSKLEKVVNYFQDQLTELGIWKFASSYVPMTDLQRDECHRRSLIP